MIEIVYSPIQNAGTQFFLSSDFFLFLNLRGKGFPKSISFVEPDQMVGERTDSQNSEDTILQSASRQPCIRARCENDRDG